MAGVSAAAREGRPGRPGRRRRQALLLVLWAALWLMALPASPALAQWTTRHVAVPVPGAYVTTVDDRFAALVAGDGASAEIYLYNITAEALFRVTNNDFEDRGGYLGSQGLYWSGWVEGDWEIFYAPYDTLAVSRVTDNALDDEWPVLAGSWLAWVQHDGDDLEVVARNLGRPGTSEVRLTDNTNQDADFGNLSSDGRYLAWHSLLPGPDREVQFCDTLDPDLPVFRLYDSGRHLGWAQVSGGTIAMLGFGPGVPSEVWAYQIPPAWGGDGEFRRMSALGVEAGFTLPYLGSVTDGSHVVFTEGTAPATAVRLADAVTGQAETVSTTAECHGAQLADGVACWLGKVDGHDEVFAYSVAKAEATRLTWTTEDEYWPHTAAGVVAWTVPQGVATGLFLASEDFAERVFVDVGGRHPNCTAIEGLYEVGVVSGTRQQWGVRWFDPDQPVLRAQFAKMMVGTLPLPVDEGMTSPFVDLDENDPADLYPHEFVASAYRHGVTTGVTAQHFEPWANISRAQAVTMLVRGAESRWPGVLRQPVAGPAASALGAFDPAHAGNMWVAEHNGLLHSVGGFGSSWSPWQPATRAEVAQMLWNLWNLLPGR